MVDIATGLESLQEKPLWILALIGIFGVNPAIDYVNGGPDMGVIQDQLTKTDESIEDISDNVAILAGTVGNHISHAEDRLDELMEQINYNEIKRQVEAQIDSKSRIIRENEIAISDLDLSEMRRRSEGTMPSELISEYDRKRRDLREEITILEREIRNEEAKLL
jgi:hypothetical protein